MVLFSDNDQLPPHSQYSHKKMSLHMSVLVVVVVVVVVVCVCVCVCMCVWRGETKIVTK